VPDHPDEAPSKVGSGGSSSDGNACVRVSEVQVGTKGLWAVQGSRIYQWQVEEEVVVVAGGSVGGGAVNIWWRSIHLFFVHCRSGICRDSNRGQVRLHCERPSKSDCYFRLPPPPGEQSTPDPLKSGD
jgi:hypothetical protein